MFGDLTPRHIDSDDGRDGHWTYALMFSRRHICIPGFRWRCDTNPELARIAGLCGDMSLIDSIESEPHLRACERALLGMQDEYPYIEIVYLKVPYE